MSFGSDFQRRWSINVELTCAPQVVAEPVDADTSLNVAFNTKGMLHLADASGVIRWGVASQAIRLRIADNGDVFAFEAAVDGPRRLRYASLDGSILETTTLPPMVPGDFVRAFIQRDGSFVTALDPYHSVVARVDSSGVLRWQRSLHSYVESVRLDRNDMVSAVSSLGTQIFTFDGTSGATTDVQDNDVGQEARLLSADSDGYTMSMNDEIYRFGNR